MKEITELTPDQVQLMSHVCDEWISRSLSWRPVNVEAVRKALPLLYKGLDLPREIAIVPSPMAAQLVANQSAGAIVNANVNDTVNDTVRDTVNDTVRATVRDTVNDTVRDTVSDTVHATVYANVYDTVNDDVHANVKYVYPCWSADCGLVSLAAHADYYRQIGLTFDPAVNEYIEYQRDSGAWYVIAQKGHFVVSEAPVVCRRDDEGRLHCEDGPAIAWRDCYALFAWHGTIIPGEWIADKSSLTPQKALKWDNLEQRRAACEIIGWARILDELDAKVVDADHPRIGTLLQVDLPGEGGDATTERFLRVECGTGRTFALPVPPSQRVAIAANLWTYGVEWSELSKADKRMYRESMINNRT